MIWHITNTASELCECELAISEEAEGSFVLWDTRDTDETFGDIGRFDTAEEAKQYAIERGGKFDW